MRLPILPVRATVLLPGVALPITVRRERSIAAVEAALATEDKRIAVLAQRNQQSEDPDEGDLSPFGTEAVIRRMSRDPVLQLMVVGIQRVRLSETVQARPYLIGELEPEPLVFEPSAEVEALRREVLELASRTQALAEPSRSGLDLQALLGQTRDPARALYSIASVFGIDWSVEQQILEADSGKRGLEILREQLMREVEVLELRRQLSSQVEAAMTKEHREHLLRRQLRAIQEELGDADSERAVVGALKKRLDESGLPNDARREVDRELSRLEQLPAAAAEVGVIRSYLELVADLPWRREAQERIDLAEARRILDEDHYDLEDVKRRILEHLGVMKLNPSARGPILCFVGPPGVGKTSLGQSIARALGRTMERLSLGGVSDEAELRGHRRTYVGAMPGRLIAAIRRAGIKNPLIMLDEVDKLGRDFRGDPAAALLEILDPAQNHTFRDNYLDLPFDLSHVLFLTTANTLDPIPRALLDRFEVLRLPGYSAEEKLAIARRFLIARRLEEAGLSREQCEIPDAVVQEVIARYTREAGVRQLERALGAIARHTALEVAEGTVERRSIRPEELPVILGPPVFSPERARGTLGPGVAAGLAWTESGGEVLYVEAVRLMGAQGLTLTGQLGAVMQESAKAAHSFLWSNAQALGLDPAELLRSGLHVHVPAGATPKDGPSAGVTIATALASLYSGVPVRADTAMTGEITLSGLVLPVGGVKEKALAARRAGLRRVILPAGNEKDLRELGFGLRADLELILVDRIEEVLDAALAVPLARPRAAARDGERAAAVRASHA